LSHAREVLLCANRYCSLPRRHQPGCGMSDCPGCLPGRAADGLRLCGHHVDRIGPDATLSAQLHDDCALYLTAAGGAGLDGGGPGGRGQSTGLSLNGDAAYARQLIRITLQQLAVYIAHHRGIHPPGAWRLQPLPSGVQGPLNRIFKPNGGKHALAAYIATHARWLAAQPNAGETSQRLAELVAAGRAAYPSQTRIIQIGGCPQTDDDGLPCVGKLRALVRDGAALLPSAVHCDTDDEHVWNAGQWHALGRTLRRARPQSPRLVVGSTVRGHGGWPERRIGT
jgi:hypothetical protein